MDTFEVGYEIRCAEKPCRKTAFSRTTNLIDTTKAKEKTMKKGFLVRDFHSTAKTEKAALRQYLRARWNRIVAARNSRLANESLSHIFVTPDDSLAGGNCETGTNSFIESRVKPVYGDIGALRADYLLKIEDSEFTRRAINAAASRSGLKVAV